jgi:hypothetical protein
MASFRGKLSTIGYKIPLLLVDNFPLYYFLKGKIWLLFHIQTLPNQKFMDYGSLSLATKHSYSKKVKKSKKEQ